MTALYVRGCTATNGLDKRPSTPEIRKWWFVFRMPVGAGIILKGPSKGPFEDGPG